MATPAGSDETIVEEETETIELAKPSMTQDIAEQKELIERLKAERELHRMQMEEPMLDTALPPAPLKREREDDEENEEELRFNFKEPETEQRQIATNKRVSRFQLEPRTKSVAWGVAAFAIGMGAVCVCFLSGHGWHRLISSFSQIIPTKFLLMTIIVKCCPSSVDPLPVQLTVFQWCIEPHRCTLSLSAHRRHLRPKFLSSYFVHLVPSLIVFLRIQIVLRSLICLFDRNMPLVEDDDFFTPYYSIHMFFVSLNERIRPTRVARLWRVHYQGAYNVKVDKRARPVRTVLRRRSYPS